MSCEAFEQMIALGDDLPDTRLDAHLRSCESCRGFAAEMRASRRGVRSLAAVPIDGEMLAGVRAAVLEKIERAGHRGALASFPATVPLRRLALAAGLILAAGGAFLLRSALPVAPTTDPDLEPTQRFAPEAAVAEAPEPVSEPVERHSVPETAVSVEPVTMAVPSEASTETLTVVASVPPAQTLTGTPIETPGPEPAVLGAAPPIVIKLISEEADLVIYWLVNPPLEVNKEKTHEISAV